MSEFPRDPTMTELAVLQLLLSVEFPGAADYRAQLANAVVTSRCPCGCLEFSVDVAPDGSIASARKSAVSAWSQEQQVDLTLETHEGRLTGVGLMWFGDDENRIDPDLSTFSVRAEPLP